LCTQAWNEDHLIGVAPVRGSAVRDDENKPDQGVGPTPHVPCLTTPAMDRAVELARELLRQRGLSEEEIDAELNKPPGTGFASF
jgi:hypothetical protein